MRESMLSTLAVPNTGMAITIDVGEARDIHPKNKQAVGKRLAHWALGDVYGRDIAASGPLLESFRVDGDRAVVSFRHAAGGLRTSDGGSVKGFALAGQDGIYRWADATIENATVIVRHHDIRRPVTVRYAWADNPDCNLVNGAGLPASPFRTDPRR